MLSIKVIFSDILRTKSVVPNRGAAAPSPRVPFAIPRGAAAPSSRVPFTIPRGAAS